jgi:hypothetical protein
MLTLCQLGDNTAAPRPIEGHNPFNTLRGPVHDMANVYQGMGIPTSQQTNPLIAAGRVGSSAAGPHAPQHAMYPVVYHGLPLATSNQFMHNRTPTRGQGVAHMTQISPMSGGMPVMGPLYNTTPPATPMAMSDFASPRGMQPYGRRPSAQRLNRSPFYSNAGHHNHVDVNRIRDGIDVRTTVSFPRWWSA